VSTRKLKCIANNQKVSLNSLLLISLDKASRMLLQNEQIEVSWFIPINMRGSIKLPKNTDNHVSGIDISIENMDCSNTVHLKIKSKLEQKQHYSYFYLINIITGLGTWLTKLTILINLHLCLRKYLVFSNLGEFNSEENTFDSWLFCPPVFEHMPLSAGCIVFNNKICLTLQIHPKYCTSLNIAQKVTDRWINLLEKL
jgi:hypothetical protein